MDKDIRFTKKKVDESWKDQPAPSEVTPKEKPASKSEPTQPGSQINFETFISSLALQAFMCLGLIENPATKKKTVNLQAAKETIEILTLLQEKTTNNLSDKESQLLQSALYDLRTKFVEIVDRLQSKEEEAT